MPQRTVIEEDGTKSFFIEVKTKDEEEPKKKRKRRAVFSGFTRHRNPRLMTGDNFAWFWVGYILTPGAEKALFILGWYHYIGAKASYRFAERMLLSLREDDGISSEKSAKGSRA